MQLCTNETKILSYLLSSVKEIVLVLIECCLMVVDNNASDNGGLSHVHRANTNHNSNSVDEKITQNDGIFYQCVFSLYYMVA